MKKGLLILLRKKVFLKYLSPRDLSSFVMATETASTIKKDSLHTLTLRTLYRDGDASFVLLTYYQKEK